MTSKKEHLAGELPATLLAPLDRLYCSPALILVTVAVCVLASEMAATKLLHHFGLLNHPIHHIIDSLLQIALLLPVLVMLVFRPLRLHLAQRQQAEAELAAGQNKLNKILDTIPTGVCIVNQSYGIEYANAALTKEFGPVEGRTCFDYFIGRSNTCPECLLDDIRAGKSSTSEWRSEKSGKIYEFFDTPLSNADGSVARLSLVRDITARKQAEDELRNSRERLRSLSDHLQRAREEERRAIGREIHDELGQVLATVQLGVSALAEEYRDHRHLTEKIAGMEQLLVSAIGTVRKISSELRPTILDELGLAEAIEWQVTEFARRSGLGCTHDILLQEDDFSREMATAVFRICQEALTNVIRHSGATHVDVLLEQRKRRIVLVVRDNGRGITREQVHGGQSLGIIGMRERAYMLGGRVRVCSGEEGGTTVLAHIPLGAPGRDR